MKPETGYPQWQPGITIDWRGLFWGVTPRSTDIPPPTLVYLPALIMSAGVLWAVKEGDRFALVILAANLLVWMTTIYFARLAFVAAVDFREIRKSLEKMAAVGAEPDNRRKPAEP